MKDPGILGIVVNAPGIQERRARALVPHLGRWSQVELLIRPSTEEMRRSIRRWRVLYVIDPGAAGFPAAAIGRSLRRTTVVEMGDPQRELYAAQGRRRWLQAVGGVIDAAVARHADGVVVRGEGLARELNVAVPWVTIPDGVDVEQFRPTVRGQATRRVLAIPDDALVLGVVGSIHWSADRSFAYGLDVIDAAAHLSRRKVHVLIVGDGSGLPRLRARAAVHGLDNVHFVGRVPHEDVPHFITAMDVCVSTQSRDAIGRARTTAKLPEYLACDRFVLSTAVGTAARLLPADMLLDTDLANWDQHIGGLRARIDALIPRQPVLRLGGGTRALATEHFSYPALGRRLGLFLEECTRRRSTSVRGSD
jgi:glycosyltransferase involved in cell wall biosynthesis